MDLQRELDATVDFVLVYLEEAHPVEEWMYDGVKHKISQHKTLDERRAAAALLRDERDRLGATDDAIPLCVDLMDNAASLAYGAIRNNRGSN